jgi:hypothetical protein
VSCIALGYGLDDRGLDFWQGLGIFLFTTASRPVLEPPPPASYPMGTGVYFLEGKAVGE